MPDFLTAKQLIQTVGQRATDARVAVLGILLATEHALSHQEIEQQLASKAQLIDRVTLYRVLEWALKTGLAHKLTGEDRVWYYNASRGDDHAHFHCECCGQIYCLNEIKPSLALTLPKGFVLHQADVSIQGHCPSCAQSDST